MESKELSDEKVADAIDLQETYVKLVVEKRGCVLEEFKELKETRGIIASLESVCGHFRNEELAMTAFAVIMNEYQEQPYLLDPHLESLLNQLLAIIKKQDIKMDVKHLCFKCIYMLTKTRGYKVIVRLLPHEVVDLEQVLALLAEQNPEEFGNWETRYVLLLWLSIVSMIPFDMVRLDSNMAAQTGEVRKPIMERIMEVGQTYLKATDKTRDAAAYMLSKFLTRHDVKTQCLPAFMEFIMKGIETEVTSLIGLKVLSGFLMTLALLFKHGKREDLEPYAPKVLQKLLSLNVPKYTDVLIRKLAAKLVQRLGLTCLKVKVAAWRYQRGTRSLTTNLGAQSTSDVAPSTAATTAEEDDEDYDIPDEVEEVIEYLLNGLKDDATIVRWSAAKGIGRITGRLPKELADEVVGSLMELCSKREGDGAWHGGCLALAELARRGLLLPERLPEVVPIVIKALNYDEKRGYFSVGAHVRDAACYVCWAFARAYEPQEITPHVKEIANALVIVSVFDREVNVRRAAAAAFQENVGRQGQFPYGIDILTTCDYFAVGNRTNCYLELSVFVAQFPEYTQAMIDHLVEVKSNHWDVVMRELTAEGLHVLTPKAPDYMIKTVLPQLLKLSLSMDLNTRHGAILGAVEVVHGLAKIAEQEKKPIGEMLGTATLQGLKDIAIRLEEAKLYRGLGGEHTRKAVCMLIHKLSLSKLPFENDPVITVWQNLIDDCLAHVEPEIQKAAISALPAFCNQYYVYPDGNPNPVIQENLLMKYLKLLNASLENVRMGHALALGALPKSFIQGKFKMVLNGLSQACVFTKEKSKWAETRRDAITAISQMSSTVGFEKNGSPSDVVCKENLYELYDIFFQAMQDYTLDSRGDIGAWVREASMTALQNITTILLVKEPSLVTPEICKNLFCCLVQQSVEKIDRTRSHAGNIFINLLYHSPEVPHIPDKEELLKIFPKSDLDKINWGVPSDTFPRFTKLLSLPNYSYHVMLGMTVSVGGMTESLVRQSQDSLFQYLSAITEDQTKMLEYSKLLLKIFEDYLKEERVSLSMLKTLDKLLTAGTFDVLMGDDQTFATDLIAVCKKEMQNSGNPQKLLASVEVFCGLLPFGGEIKKKSTQQLLIFMCHRYPILRKTAANKLYEALLTYEDIIDEEHLEEVMTVLSETLWDDPVSKIRPIRNKLCESFGVPVPVIAKKKTTQKGGGDTDEM